MGDIYNVSSVNTGVGGYPFTLFDYPLPSTLPATSAPRSLRDTFINNLIHARLGSARLGSARRENFHDIVTTGYVRRSHERHSSAVIRP